MTDYMEVNNFATLTGKKDSYMLMGYADKCVECHFCSGGVATLFKGHRFDKNTDISNINQSDNVFLYVSEGSLEIAAGHLSPEILVEGTMLFIPSSISLYGRTLTDSNIVTCIFSRNMLSCGHHILKDIEKEATAADAVVTYRILHAKPLVSKFFSLLKESLDSGLGCPGFHDLKRKELIMLLVTLYTKEELFHLVYPSPGYKDNFKDSILRNYMHIPDVKTFASKANMSISTFQRWFKVEFGQLPGEWLKERRAELVLREIKNTDKGFSIIADEFGFSSASHFGTFCKQHFGMLPSQIRPKRQKQETVCRLR